MTVVTERREDVTMRLKTSIAAFAVRVVTGLRNTVQFRFQETNSSLDKPDCSVFFKEKRSLLLSSTRGVLTVEVLRVILMDYFRLRHMTLILPPTPPPPRPTGVWYKNWGLWTNEVKSTRVDISYMWIVSQTVVEFCWVAVIPVLLYASECRTLTKEGMRKGKIRR
jgi:hypothetical protein